MRKIDVVYILEGLINFTFGLAVLGLFIRFLFRLFAANPESGIVKFLYDSTNPLLTPFRNIFEPYVIESKYVFEFSTLIAITFYVLIAWLLIEFIEFIVYSAGKYKRV